MDGRRRDERKLERDGWMNEWKKQEGTKEGRGKGNRDDCRKEGKRKLGRE